LVEVDDKIKKKKTRMNPAGIINTSRNVTQAISPSITGLIIHSLHLSHNASDVSSERITDTPEVKHLLHSPIKSLFTIIMT